VRSERQLQRLMNLIERVPDPGRYERGQFDLHLESVDLARLARDIAERFCGQG